MPIREQTIDQSKLGRLCDALREIDYPVSKILYLKEHDGPLVEDIEGKPESKCVTFLYYDERNECKDVVMYSRVGFASIFEGQVIRPKSSKSPTGGGLPKFVMKPIVDGSNIWAVTVELPVDSCFSYCFGVQPKMGLEKKESDSLNPQIFSSPSSALVWSVFDLSPSGIKLQERMKAIEDDHRLIRGSVSDLHVPSQAGERKLIVHLPQGYNEPANQDTKYPMRLFLDGGWYLNDIEVPAILDDEHTINIMLEPKEVTGLGAMKDREVEYLPHRCDLLVLRDVAALAEPPITSNAACVRVGEKLFYVNKCGGYQNTELKLSSEALAQFDKEIAGDLPFGVPRSLTDEELKRIEEITGGELARIAKTTDSTCPYVGNIEAFAKFLSKEFMDGVREKFRVSNRPSDITICGSSLGGFAATYIGLNYPQVFGNVLTQSAALWVGGDLLPQLGAGKFNIAQLQKSCFYFEASKSDAPGISRTNPEFKAELLARGIPSGFVERNGEHSGVTWAKTLPEAVAAIQKHHEMTPSYGSTLSSVSGRVESLDSKV